MAGEAIGVLLTLAVLAPGCPAPCLDAGPVGAPDQLAPELDELPLDPGVETLEPTLDPIQDEVVDQARPLTELPPLDRLLDRALPGTPGPRLEAPVAEAWLGDTATTDTLVPRAIGHRAEDPEAPGDGSRPHAIPAPTRTTRAQPHAVSAQPGVHGAEQASLPPATAAGLLVALAAIGLYHRLTKKRLLAHEGRQRILELLRDDPGIGTTEIAEALGCCYRTARHHLDKLAAFDMVTCQRLGHRTVWSLPTDTGQARTRLTGHAAAILETLDDQPGLHLSGLARELAVSKATVKHHLDRLVERGLVEDERIGPLRCFRVVEER